MKLLVFSDTHGDLTGMEAALKDHQNVDKIIHLGDYVKDGNVIKSMTKVELIQVKGNGDYQSSERLYRILKTEMGNIYLSHGHLERVKSGMHHLYYRSMECQCIAAFFGHTHQALFQNQQGFYFLNPGSFTYPPPGQNGSYMVAEISKSGMTVKTCYV